jgi:hypothetical protein
VEWRGAVVGSRYGGSNASAGRQQTPALRRCPEVGDDPRLGLVGLLGQLGQLGPLAYRADFG